MIKQRLRTWLDDGLRRLARNAGTLIIGNVMQSCVGLVSLALTARLLGAADFGRLVVAIAYAAIVTQLIGFQSWQAVIKYGAGALEQGDVRQFMGIVRAGITLDVAAAVVAALLAVAGVMLGGNLVGIDSQSHAVAILASLAIVTNIVGTPTALLRMFDRYRLFIVQSFLTSVVKLIFVALAAWRGGGLWEFALAWVGSQVFGYLLLAALALRELAKRQPLRGAAQPLRVTFRQHPDLARFFVFTNLNTTARTLRDLDVPLLALVLGASATGHFKLARQLAATLNKIIDPFFVAIYPDLARLHATGRSDSALQLVRRSSLTLGACGVLGLIVFLAVGEPLMVLILGESFRSAYAVTAWCVVGSVIWAFAQPISPMLMVYGRTSALFGINIVMTALYLIAVPFAAIAVGASGVGAAFACYLLLWTGLTTWLLMQTAAAKGHGPAARAQDA